MRELHSESILDKMLREGLTEEVGGSNHVLCPEWPGGGSFLKEGKGIPRKSSWHRQGLGTFEYLERSRRGGSMRRAEGKRLPGSKAPAGGSSHTMEGLWIFNAY